MSKSIICILILIVVITACNPKQKSDQLSMDERLTKNLDVFIDSCWNDQNVTKLNELVAKDFVRILNGINVAGNENELGAHMNVFFTGFPDLKIKYNNLHIDGNNLFMNWECTGSNTGVFGEMPPTGKKIKIQGLSHLYFTDEGKLYKEDVYYNELDMLQQLGYSLEAPVLE